MEYVNTTSNFSITYTTQILYKTYIIHELLLDNDMTIITIL